MAHKKGGGSSRNGRDSNSQRRGIKAHDGQVVSGGSILVRQCGNKWHPSQNVGEGRDYTLYARVTGRVRYFRTGTGKRFVRIEPVEQPVAV